MFRTLATRLVALWVLAALALFLVTVAAVTAFSLSAFAVSANQSMDAVGKRAPEEARIAVSRSGSFAAAADDIARDLVRPGLRVGIFPKAPGPPLAFASIEGDESVVVHIPRGEPHDGTSGHPAPFGRLVDKELNLPFALNSFLHIEPRRIEISGGRIVIFVDPHPLAHTIGSFWLAMLAVGLALVAAAIVVGRYLTSLALRPLAQTTAALQRFAVGDFTPRPVEASGRDEIAELVVAYNGAVEQVAHAFEERRAAELQMRQFVGDAGHELRTPLTVIMGFIDVLRRRGTADPTTTKIFDTMLAESRRMRTLIEKLILLARLENVQFAEAPALVDVGEVAARAVSTFQPLDRHPRITLVTEPDALAEAQEGDLHEAIRNLIENALKYAPLSVVEVRVETEPGRVVVAVADRGPGLSAEDCEHVFDRFYRGSQRGDREGFGLGLAIVKRAVERAGGSVGVESEPGHGARFTIRLPRATEASATA